MIFVWIPLKSTLHILMYVYKYINVYAYAHVLIAFGWDVSQSGRIPQLSCLFWLSKICHESREYCTNWSRCILRQEASSDRDDGSVTFDGLPISSVPCNAPYYTIDDRALFEILYTIKDSGLSFLLKISALFAVGLIITRSTSAIPPETWLSDWLHGDF